jgi:hypothetical protein
MFNGDVPVDPVKHYDRRLSPLVVSGSQIVATGERRSLLRFDHIIDSGKTTDRRFLA